jgi:hypothetical protein
MRARESCLRFIDQRRVEHHGNLVSSIVEPQRGRAYGTEQKEMEVTPWQQQNARRIAALRETSFTPFVTVREDSSTFKLTNGLRVRTSNEDRNPKEPRRRSE